MTKGKRAKAAAVLAAAFGFQAGMVTGDEGMWTLDNLPAAQLKERYGFEATPQWLEHVRLASVRFNDGGSGAFVSKSGLVLTNHHVALGQLQKMSTAEKDYVQEGFFARAAAEEQKCPDLELNQLVSIENVTERVLKAIDPKAPEKEQNEARKAEMSRIEKESTDQTKLRSDVVELYQGGEYWLYRYKKYTDIRLVMAPEAQAAFFGGDPDNFTYPRYDLDFAFFRAYENDQPVAAPHFFKWNSDGPQENELVFVTGHPGSTDRLRTIAQLEYQRDQVMTTRLELLGRRRKAFYDYSAKGPEQTRRAKDRIFGIENAIKAITGELEGLREPRLWSRKLAQEKEFRALVDKSGELSKKYGGAWDKIAWAQQQLGKRHKQIHFRRFFGSKLAEFAGTVVRYVEEVEKPNEKRFEEFRDSALESLDFRLFSKAPVYPDMEEFLLADVLAESLQQLGPADAHVKAALGGQTPQQAAHELVSNTKLADPEFRRQLVKGGKKAVAQSKDPMIVWARGLDASYRELRKWYEDTIQPVESFEGNKIAKARFALYGKSTYPDATFTLRLSFGRAVGYDEGTTKVPYKTNFHGLYGRSASFDNKPPFDLPKKLELAKDRVELSTPLNFVTTNDIIGGNSGSPMFNRNAEYVGLIFDGNIPSLVGRYAYSDEQGRAVGVHSAGIEHALRRIYGMDALAKELIGR